ncbi:hypothetical protein FLO80_18340 [Aquicoccus porphyridii]|uniref:Uncharacterized protein n=1 Tax=Aquicoccus porphyridii TaxID=1852029 RepID=A0A5A9YYY1_9RHOB|nr:hypothetical protein [Aquicoccus porphyridii]KAA0910075.1 hypothetical protein FLO80_18340 [Aquicoccus porphyridii]RAI53675.1 hypothetical protein DOO74_11665 [Rhodobacteraceae bacterium AsT-22]
MTDFLTEELRAGLAQARKLAARKNARMRVKVGEDTYPVLRLWKDGFALDAEDAPHMRGLVDLYDGTRHKAQCLVIASEKEGAEMRYEYKRTTTAHDRAPLDFARDDEAPTGLIEHAR